MFQARQINRWLFRKGSKFNQLADDIIYLNNGTEGSMPDCVVDAFKAGLAEWNSNPTVSYETDLLLGKQQKNTRLQIAEFLDVDLNNICMTNNTTMGLAMVLTGLEFKVGDRVVTTNHEHPAIISPLWMLKQRLGIEVIVRSFPDHKILKSTNPDELLDYLVPDIPQLRSARAICLSHVYATHGIRLPLDKLRRRAQALDIEYIIIDGAQAVGMVNLNKPENRVDNCDFYAAPTHKWMNGPPGTGILYIRNPYVSPPEFYPTLSQKMGDYMCSDNPEYHQPITEALQVRGCQNTPSYTALLKLLQLIQEMGGPEAIEDHVLTLSESVRDFIASRSTKALISPSDKDLRSGLISFFPFNWSNPEQCFKDERRVTYVNRRLSEKGIQVRYIAFPTVSLPQCLARKQEPGNRIDCPVESVERQYCIRVSTGLFNTVEQVESFKKILKEVLTELPVASDRSIVWEQAVC
jgi:selenocysteine lyase/cysteine desulfurase